ncbi:MAG: DUF4433 domain-containing protein [Archangium sp.]|nr:DUF4433 domain-containing protein [Archangium sp.]
MSPQTAVPQDPSIFHITHVANLASIIHHGGLWCDAQRIARALTNTNIGHLHIKQRRLNRLMTTSGGGKLGDYVPFNFCPRSVMLFVVSCGHQDYAGGQEDVVHLVSTVSRAVALGRPWAFTDRHAELAHSLHYEDLSRLNEVPWDVMPVHYWTGVKEERQAEFLVRDFFDWSGVAEIGVMTEAAEARVRQALIGSQHVPAVTIRRQWYY